MMFVKASDDYSSTQIDQAKSQIQDPKNIFIQESAGQMSRNAGRHYGLGSGPKRLKSAMKEFSKDCQSWQENERLGQFYQLAKHMLQIRQKGPQKGPANSVSLFHMATQGAQLTNPSVDFKSDKGMFICELIVDRVLVSTGCGTNKKIAKSDAFDKGLEKLEKQFLKINVTNSGDFILESSSEPFSVFSSDGDTSMESADKDASIVILDKTPPIRRSKKTRPQAVSQAVAGSFECGIINCDSVEDDARLEKFQQLGTAFRKLQQTQQNPAEVVHMAVQKCQMKLMVDYKQSSDNFLCDVKVDSVLIAQGKSVSKRAAKITAFDICAQVMTNPFLRIIEPDTNMFVLESSHVPFPIVSSHPARTRNQNYAPQSGNMTKWPQGLPEKQINPRKRKIAAESPFSNFVIMQPNIAEENLNTVSILQNSAAINKIQIQYDYFDLRDGVQCIVYLGNELLIDVTAPSKQEAKQHATDTGLVKLKEVCWTIKIKQQADTNESGISKDEIGGNASKSADAIPESNVGNKLLKLMGWAGGGVGKQGQGIAEPVSVSAVINRSGLGLQAEQGISKDFLPHIKNIIIDYARSMNFGDLTFTSEFSKEQRALIHKESQKIGLKSHSHGKGDNRYLIVSRKMSARELLMYIKQKGGDTPKYSLVPPTV